MDLKDLLSRARFRQTEDMHRLSYTVPKDFSIREIEEIYVEVATIIGNCYHENANRIFIFTSGGADSITMKGEGIDIYLHEDEIDALPGFSAFLVPKGVAYAVDLTGGSALLFLSEAPVKNDTHSREVIVYR